MAREPEVLILNAATEEEPARRVGVFLEGAGFRVRRGGDARDPLRAEETAAALGRAQVVVVIWSARALDAPGLVAAARLAGRSGRLVSLTDGGAEETSRPAHLKGRRLPHWGDARTVLERVALAAARPATLRRLAGRVLPRTLAAVGAGVAALTIFAESGAAVALAPWAEALADAWQAGTAAIVETGAALAGVPAVPGSAAAVLLALAFAALCGGVWLAHPGFRPGISLSGRVLVRTMLALPVVFVGIFAVYHFGAEARGSSASHGLAGSLVAFGLLYFMMVVGCLPAALTAAVRPENVRRAPWAAAMVTLALALVAFATMPGPGGRPLLEWAFAPGTEPARLPVLLGLLVALPFALLIGPTRALLRSTVTAVGLAGGLLLASETTRALDGTPDPAAPPDPAAMPAPGTDGPMAHAGG